MQNIVSAKTDSLEDLRQNVSQKKDSELHLLGLFLGDDAGTRSRLRVPVVRFAEMLTQKYGLPVILEKKDYICGRKSDK